MNQGLRIGIIAALGIVFVGAVLLKEGRKPSAEATGNPRIAVEPASLPRLVDLGSDTCVPCKMMMPILEQLRTTYAGQFDVEVIDVRKNRAAAQLYGIRVIPTQIFFDAEEREVFRHEGFISADDILAKWKELGVAVSSSAAGTEGT